MAESNRQLIYFADPMCSWCWGFSPVIQKVAERFAEEAPVLLVMGGLSPGTTEPLGDSLKASIREHWEHVHEASGQPFDHAFFERTDFVYDTEPACRAVVAARRLNADAALPFLAAVHRSFYAENRDVTRRDVLGEVAAEAGFEPEAFRAAFDDAETRRDTQVDFAFSQRLGIRGFPTLLAHDGRTLTLITMGYQPLEAIEAQVADWLSSRSS